MKESKMSLFQEIQPPTHLKAGIFGFAGSGKTFTSALLAIGLWQKLNKQSGYNKPVFFIDSETGSSYIKTLFDKAGVPIQGIKTRAFVTLLAGMREAIAGDHILLIDSISHFWQEIMRAYLKKNGLTRLRLRDFVPLKEEWSTFPTLYLNSPIHIIMSGRAGYDWDEENDDEEEGKKKLVKTGTKMKAEGDLGYEPTLLIEMEHVHSDSSIGSTFINRAFVIKDKFDVLKGKSFDMPTFEDFAPHIDMLAIGGVPPTIDTDTSSESMMTSHQGVAKRLKERDILSEELWEEMPLRFNSRTDDGKKQGAAFLHEAFGTLSKMAIESMSNEKINEGLIKLKALPMLTTEEKKK
jgi:hypothetical protein